ncbi:MAG: hypothetical protein FWC94_07875 [Bacteroidales bacterium]|nr:hypothetical protein [Bacteroidales bacterium]
MKKYDINEQRNADKICNDSPTEVQPPPNLCVAPSAQRGIRLSLRYYIKTDAKAH